MPLTIPTLPTNYPRNHPGASGEPPPLYPRAMHTITLWRWRITDERGRRVATRYRMTEAEALKADPAAERISGIEEVRRVHAPGEYPGHHQIAPKRGAAKGG